MSKMTSFIYTNVKHNEKQNLEYNSNELFLK